MAEIVRAVRVPVDIDEKDSNIRQIKSKALDKAMAEARYLGNLAIRYAIARDLRKVPNERDPVTGQVVHPETWVTRVVTEERKYLQYGNVATLVRNFAMRLYKRASKDSLVGRKGLPTYRSMFVPFRHLESSIEEVEGGRCSQFVLSPGGFVHVWLPDDLVAELSGGTGPVLSKEEKRLRLITRLSEKDYKAIGVLRRIATGEYQFCDSQLQKAGKDIIAVLSYRFDPGNHYTGPGFLGHGFPVICEPRRKTDGAEKATRSTWCEPEMERTS